MPRSLSAAQPSLNAQTVEKQSTAVHTADSRVLNTPAQNVASRGSEPSWVKL